MAAPMKFSMYVLSLARSLSKTRTVHWQKTVRYSSSDSTDVTDGSQTHSMETANEVTVQDEGESKPILSGFAQAFEKHSKVHQTDLTEIDAKQEIPKSFATLLRHSTHVHIGSGNGQIVAGKIFHTVEDDLYIDFGGKFHCVCKRPEQDVEKFHRGAKVHLRLKDVELTDHFIGAARDLSLLEADADLLGLAKS